MSTSFEVWKINTNCISPTDIVHPYSVAVTRLVIDRVVVRDSLSHGISTTLSVPFMMSQITVPLPGFVVDH